MIFMVANEFPQMIYERGHLYICTTVYTAATDKNIWRQLIHFQTQAASHRMEEIAFSASKNIWHIVQRSELLAEKLRAWTAWSNQIAKQRIT